ncbi:MAG: glycosyltransferase [Candidatus Zixiibacteriota bacterium]|nr:MAG: glycosyltransferase [candidate division Zixibacteria bacterium]
MAHQDVVELRENLARGQLTAEEVTSIANEYLDKNELEEAYPIISLLTEAPEASNHTRITAGMLALALSKPDDAAAFFEQVLENDTDHFDANYNLVLLDMEQGRLERAAERLGKLVAANPDNASLLSDMAVICHDRGDVKTAIEYWQKALTIDPNLAIARNNAMEVCVEKNLVTEGKHLLMLNAKTPGVSSGSIREIQSWAERLTNVSGQPSATDDGVQHITSAESGIRGKKIAVFAAFDTFLKDIVGHLSKGNETRTFRKGTADRMQLLLEWADIAWFEWCDSYLVEATKLPKTCPIVCRLHSYEAFSELPSMVDWTKVDLLILVNDSVKQVLENRIEIPTRQIVIHNAVDGSRFTIPDSKVYGKKIASVGYINYRKNPGLLLYCFKKIHQYDPEYSLHIAGEHQGPRLQLYFDHFLKENPLPVYYDGWVDDMAAWYADKDYVISTSLFESFHYSIAEGMACGLIPLIHNWYGAANLYPNDFLFNDPDECLEILKSMEGRDRAGLGRQNRQFILDRYNPDDKMAAISAELQRLVESTVAEGQTPA